MLRLRRGKRPSPQRGFTLMEVLISLVLGAIAMIGVIALYRASTNASSFSRRGTEAAVLAQDKLERLRTETAVTGSDPTLIDELGKSAVAGPFTRSWTVTPATPDYVDISVNVSWPDEGTTRNFTVRGRRSIP
jgi:prepilin-type N-terminal cleavage/methylation domain-containing protein